MPSKWGRSHVQFVATFSLRLFHKDRHKLSTGGLHSLATTRLASCCAHCYSCCWPQLETKGLLISIEIDVLDAPVLIITGHPLPTKLRLHTLGLSLRAGAGARVGRESVPLK